MSPDTRRGVRLAAPLLVALLALLAAPMTGSAQAAAKTVTVVLTQDEISAATALTGDAVAFRNDDDVTHTLTATTGGWSFTVEVAAGATSAPQAVGGRAGDDGFTDAYSAPGMLGLPQDTSRDGVVKVTAAATPTPAPTRSTGSGTAQPTTAPGSSASPGAPATGTGTTGGTGSTGTTGGGSGVALQPRLDTGSLLAPPSLTGSAAGPAPQIAPDAAAQAQTPGSLPLAQSGPALPAVTGPTGTLTESLVQPRSLRRYGLPSVLGLVLVAGVGSLVVRVVLATSPVTPGAAPRRGVRTA